MMNWISVKDRLPEKNQNVLVYQKGGVHGGNEIDIEYLQGDGFWADQGIMSEISHWMPLPEKPKEDDGT